MKLVYELLHKRIVEIDVETGERICDTKLLGFFSSEKNVRRLLNTIYNKWDLENILMILLLR